MKPNWLAIVLLLLLSDVTTGFSDAFDQVASNSQTNLEPVPAKSTKQSDFEKLKAKAENGDADAQYNLGDCYFDGKGVATNKVEAVKWYRKAAEQNNADAQCLLAGCYLNGEGVTKDEIKAIKWYRKAGEQNYAAAEFALAYIYGEGSKAIPKDQVESLKWLRKLAEQGNPLAQYTLGKMYFSGTSVAQDYSESAKWMKKAASYGLADAEFGLGLLYFNGYGVTQDYVEAHKWCNLAAAQGNNDAKKMLDILARRMTSSQIAKAQELASAFKPREESNSGNSVSSENPTATGTGFFITDDGYLISNYHVVKDATKVRLLTSAGLIDAKVVQVDAANDLALLKADGRFAPLPIAASRTGLLGGTVATVGFPDIGLQGFAPKLAP